MAWVARVFSTLVLVGWGTVAGAAAPLVTADWLAANADRPGLVVLDLRSRMSGGSKASFTRGHIPAAVYSDYLADGWRVTVEGVPGQLPPIRHLEALIGRLGIGNRDHVVLVAGGLGALDMASATRVYWTFKVLGHDGVSILDGGYRGYLADPSRPVETGWRRPRAEVFKADPRRELIATRQDVMAAVSDGVLLIDNRPPPLFTGSAKVPFISRPGTIPGAVNIPEAKLVDREGYFVSAERAARLLRAAGLEPSSGRIAFCNTGHWASLGWFVQSEILGIQNAKLYDGSMVDWAADPVRPVILPASAGQ